MIAQGILLRMHGRGTFVGEAQSSSVSVRNGRQLGFWISEEVFHFVQAGYNHILSGVTEISRSRGCQLNFHPVPEGATAIDFAADLTPNGLDGSIVVGGLNRSFIQKLQALGAPLVLVDLLNSNAAVSVSIDYVLGTQSAMNLLFDLGHREIGFIGFPNSPKYTSYWRSLEVHNLPYRPQYVEFFDPSDLIPGMLAGFRAMQTLLSSPSRPTALLITNDYAALGAIEAAIMAKVAVPEQLSIVGYDDLGQTPTPLTTIQCDLIEVGRIAARKLLSWIDTRVVPEQQTVRVKLIVRASTAPPPAI